MMVEIPHTAQILRITTLAVEEQVKLEEMGLPILLDMVETVFIMAIHFLIVSVKMVTLLVGVVVALTDRQIIQVQENLTMMEELVVVVTVEMEHTTPILTRVAQETMETMVLQTLAVVVEVVQLIVEAVVGEVTVVQESSSLGMRYST